MNFVLLLVMDSTDELALSNLFVMRQMLFHQNLDFFTEYISLFSSKIFINVQVR